jgi:hypothetical protein
MCLICDVLFMLLMQDHVVKVLLGWDVDGMSHNAVTDCLKSIQLFNLYQHMHTDQQKWAEMLQSLLSVPPAPSFAK